MLPIRKQPQVRTAAANGIMYFRNVMFNRYSHSPVYYYQAVTTYSRWITDVPISEHIGLNNASCGCINQTGRSYTAL
jgi:hypothetical protein